MARVSASLRVHGLKELDDLLAKLPDQVEGAIMEAALRESGAVIVTAARGNIRKLTGRTAADIRMEVQVQPGRQQGVAGIGARGPKTGDEGPRGWVLRFLEFGTKAHRIVAARPGKEQARRALRALKALGEEETARSLRRAIRTGRVRFKRALKLPGGVFRKAVNHPGTSAQSPLTRALAEHGDRALAVFRAALWRGIVQAAQRLRKAA